MTKFSCTAVPDPNKPAEGDTPEATDPRVAELIARLKAKIAARDAAKADDKMPRSDVIKPVEWHCDDSDKENGMDEGNEFGLKCPNCGNTDDLNVECRAWVTVIGEHVLDPYERSNFAYESFSGWHWESGDEAQCPKCGHKATVGRFQGR
jgi:hypothetical protein